MNWKKNVISEFKDGNYLATISLLEHNIENKIEPQISFVDLIYVYFYIILEVHEPPHEFSWNEWCVKLETTYKKYSSAWLDEPEVLFCIAYMGNSFGESFLGLNEKDINEMFKTAYDKQPHNLLYQWGVLITEYRDYKNRNKENEWEKLNKNIVKCILEEEVFVKSINKYSLLNEDLLWQLNLYVKK